MHRRGHMLRLTAVSVLVVLALTGFKSRGHGHGGSGGGCSSSSQDHDSSSSTSSGGGYGSGTHHDYDDDDDYYGDDTSAGSSGGSAGTPTPSEHQDGTARLVSCATAKKPYATIEVTNPNAADSSFDVHITFEDADDKTVDGTIKEVDVPASGTRTIRVPLTNAKENATEVDHCDLDPVASYHW
ncbi:hypothetical protein [Streptomyces sp. NRRL WC-3744]|uniref:hypothetical protein n=1 Tax=Streptomyces sp. NRRL WC-3744 TaxID=1463935 RepID=UPI0004C54D46|nr:hypothetical protein [Streptomyces sp. NRRL WC-3744]